MLENWYDGRNFGRLLTALARWRFIRTCKYSMEGFKTVRLLHSIKFLVSENFFPFSPQGSTKNSFLWRQSSCISNPQKNNLWYKGPFKSSLLSNMVLVISDKNYLKIIFKHSESYMHCWTNWTYNIESLKNILNLGRWLVMNIPATFAVKKGSVISNQNNSKIFFHGVIFLHQQQSRISD